MGSDHPDAANTTSVADKVSRGVPAHAPGLEASYSGAWDSQVG